MYKLYGGEPWFNPVEFESLRSAKKTMYKRIIRFFDYLVLRTYEKRIYPVLLNRNIENLTVHTSLEFDNEYVITKHKPYTYSISSCNFFKKFSISRIPHSGFDIHIENNRRSWKCYTGYNGEAYGSQELLDDPFGCIDQLLRMFEVLNFEIPGVISCEYDMDDSCRVEAIANRIGMKMRYTNAQGWSV